jgi:uncharacterized membrane protein YkoI
MLRGVKHLTLLLPLLLAVTRGAVAADLDHEQARRAYEAGEIVSLARILDAVEHDHAGKVIEVELEREDGRWIYEVEVLTSDGRVVELDYDAVTGKRAGKP